MTPRRILVVGSGGREHALCWRLAAEPGVERVIGAPGNPLMEDAAVVRPDVAAADTTAVVRLALAEHADLVVIGPEGSLAAGLADRLAEAGIACFGPSQAAAELEASKSFTRRVCAAAGVEVADGAAFDELEPALEFARNLGAPLVVKADGLAAGKGVNVCDFLPDAEDAIRAALVGGRHGAAGRRVVIERRLDGREASLIAICDEHTALLLPPARDHKRLLDDDEGPNTGGMGAYSPLPDLDGGQALAIGRQVHLPVLAELRRRGRPFRGALYAGLMLTADGPRVLEFNVRLGDPEAQAILPRLAVPLAPLLAAAAAGRLAGAARAIGLDGELDAMPTSADATVALTLAAAGYPDQPRAGDAVAGLDHARSAGSLVFGASVGRHEETGELLTAGGRVLTVVGRGADIAAAADAAYAAAEHITWPGRVMRRDIGRALAAAVGATA